MTEFKPCFWCGKISKGCIDVEEKVAFSEICFQVHCHMCGARGPFEETEQAAIDAWNKRSK